MTFFALIEGIQDTSLDFRVRGRLHPEAMCESRFPGCVRLDRGVGMQDNNPNDNSSFMVTCGWTVERAYKVIVQS